MEQSAQRATLDDIITYTPDQYFSDEELALIRNAFNGAAGSRLFKIIRKVMLPSISDPELPIEEMGRDMFMAQLDFKSMPAEEVKPAAMGLQLAAKAVLGGLVQLRTLANVKEETPANRAERRAKDSDK